ncbi:MAG: hypothetical protein HYY40_04835 [Bacteroidetes bacterium]|nr:hypothetical protein [Bacteroidota bacterium]
MNKISFLITIVFTTLYFESEAQFNYISLEKSGELSKRTIIIELFDELTGEEKTANENIINYFQKNLSIGIGIICKTRTEMTELLLDHQEKYAIITHELGTHSIQSVNRYKTIDGKRTTAGDPNGFKYNNILGTLKHYDLTLAIVSENSKINGFVTSVGFVHYILRAEDYVFASLQFNRLYNASLNKTKKGDYYDPKKAIENLQKKTWLIDKKNINFTIDKADGYDFSHKFVEYEVIRKSVLEKEPRKVFALMMWSDQANTYMWILCDTETGEILSQVAHGGVNYSEFGEHEPPGKLNLIHYKSFDSVMVNKINNKY